jgi:hypothetical protein
VPRGATTTTTTTETGRTETRTTISVSFAAANIYDALRAVVDGTIAKDYQLDLQLAEVNRHSNIVSILSGTNATYGNITFFASINAGWAGFLAGPRKLARSGPITSLDSKHSLAARQDSKAHIDQVLSYNILPVIIDRRTLASKALAPTLLNGATDLTVVATQYMVLISTNGGDGFYPTFGVTNTTVIDQVVAGNGVMYIANTVIVPPLWPTNTLLGAGLTTYLDLLKNTTYTGTDSNGNPISEQWDVRTDKWGLPVENGLTM